MISQKGFSREETSQDRESSDRRAKAQADVDVDVDAVAKVYDEPVGLTAGWTSRKVPFEDQLGPQHVREVA